MSSKVMVVLFLLFLYSETIARKVTEAVDFFYVFSIGICPLSDCRRLKGGFKVP